MSLLRGVSLTWLGHASFVATTPEGKTLGVDLWLEGNPSCPAEAYETRVDGLLVTHGHGDHLGGLLSRPELTAGPIVGIYDLTSWLGTKGFPPDRLVGMNKGGRVRLEDLAVDVVMTDARHSSSFQEDNGTFVTLGEAAGYVVTFSNDLVVYFAGDTSVFGDMTLIGELYEPDVAVLPIGDHFTMDPRAAAVACRLLGVEAVVPCHYGTFPLLTGTPEALQRELDRLGLDTALLACRPGETIS